MRFKSHIGTGWTANYIPTGPKSRGLSRLGSGSGRFRRGLRSPPREARLPRSLKGPAFPRRCRESASLRPREQEWKQGRTRTRIGASRRHSRENRDDDQCFHQRPTFRKLTDFYQYTGQKWHMSLRPRHKDQEQITFSLSDLWGFRLATERPKIFDPSSGRQLEELHWLT